MEAGRRTMKSHFKVNNGTLSRCQFNRTKRKKTWFMPSENSQSNKKTKVVNSLTHFFLPLKINWTIRINLQMSIIF